MSDTSSSYSASALATDAIDAVIACSDLLTAQGACNIHPCSAPGAWHAGVFLAEVSSLFLVPCKEDAYLLEQYKKEKQVQRVLTTAKEFKVWYKRNGGRW